jgi:hypothetical protein
VADPARLPTVAVTTLDPADTPVNVRVYPPPLRTATLGSDDDQVTGRPERGFPEASTTFTDSVVCSPTTTIESAGTTATEPTVVTVALPDVGLVWQPDRRLAARRAKTISARALGRCRCWYLFIRL